MMLTNVVKSFCKRTDLPSEKETICGNFTVLPSVKCFPLGYDEWEKVYQDEHKDYVLKKSTGSFFMHIWNKMQDFDGKTYKLKFYSESAYIKLAKLHCPKVYEKLLKI